MLGGMFESNRGVMNVAWEREQKGEERGVKSKSMNESKWEQMTKGYE